MRPARMSVLVAALAVGVTACDDTLTQPALSPDFASVGESPQPAFTLTILHSNDGESELLPGDQFGGVARFGRTVADLRAEATEGCANACGVVLVSSGDNFLAGPEFNASLASGGPFFDAMAQDMIGYDASAIGNHEFDFGPDVLADYIESFRITTPPFLSANLGMRGESRLQALVRKRRIARSTIVRLPLATPTCERPGSNGHVQKASRRESRRACRQGQKRWMKVGIIGATTPDLRQISSPRDVVVRENVADLINRETLRLQRRGVDKIILISHLQGIDEDLDLIPLLKDIDVAVAGGGDELLANAEDLLIPGDEGGVFGSYPLVATDAWGASVPVVTTSGQYRYVGRLEVHFDHNGQLLSWGGGPVRIEGAADPELEASIEGPVQAAVEALQATVIGATTVELDGRRSMVRTTETNEGNLIADALRWQASELSSSFGVPVPDVAIQNGGGIRNDEIFPAGDITEFDTFDFLPFPNFVTVIPGISREQFKEVLERAVSAVEFTSGRFAQVSGLRFTYDPSGTPQEVDGDGVVLTAGERVVDVVLESGEVIVSGGVVQPGPDLTVATIDFLARGGDGYPYRAAPFTSIGVTYQQALRNYIQDALGGTVTPGDYPMGGEGRIATVGS